MLILFYLVFLCSNFLFIKSEDTANMTIYIKHLENCTISSGYTFTDGETVNLLITVENHMHINKGWWTLLSSAGARNITSNLKTTQEKKEPIIHTSSVDKSMKGTWAFTFLYLQNVTVNKTDLAITYYNNISYVQSVCQTNVFIAPKPIPAPIRRSTPDDKLLIIACSIGAILIVIIIAQTAYIILLKAKARKLITLNTHNNLSKRSESIPNDTARYCSNPGQKMMKAPDPVDDDNRDSAIYEAPNIEISGNARMPMQPPQPPAITTMPRTPRPDHNMKIGPQAMLASALSPARSPMSDNFPHNFQRSKLDREVSVANRPPLPLPHQGHPLPGHPHPGHPHPGHPHNDRFQEVYEEMETEENTYEPPPATNVMPPRLPMPPKKVPTGNILDVKENTLKMRQGNKPLVTPKPQLARPITMTKPNPGQMTPMQQELARRRPNDAQTNELEVALRRRNNVMQVPIESIPNLSSREKSLGSTNPRPTPAPKSMPRGPPVPQPIQEEIYYNENQASSDEEWTYEPLKPLNSYDSNIYNV